MYRAKLICHVFECYIENWQNLEYNGSHCLGELTKLRFQWNAVWSVCPAQQPSMGRHTSGLPRAQRWRWGFHFHGKIIMTLRPYRFASSPQWSDSLIPKVQLRIASIFSSTFDHAKWGRWSLYRSKMDHLPQNAAFFLTILLHTKWGR